MREEAPRRGGLVVPGRRYRCLLAEVTGIEILGGGVELSDPVRRMTPKQVVGYLRVHQGIEVRHSVDP